MRELINELFEKAVKFRDNNNFSDTQIKTGWIGNDPATTKEIEKAELKLNVKLPQDYKDFLSVSNGFPTWNDAVEPSFNKIQEINYLKEIYPDEIKIWKEFGAAELGSNLEESIIVGGIGEEQWFLLIPPNNKTGEWKYWKFANWIPGEQEFRNLESYFKNIISFMNEALKEE